jgi:hypothetical protein
MILPVHERLRAQLLATLQRLYQLEPDALPQLPIEYPPKRELGDLATPSSWRAVCAKRPAPLRRSSPPHSVRSTASPASTPRRAGT